MVVETLRFTHKKIFSLIPISRFLLCSCNFSEVKRVDGLSWKVMFFGTDEFSLGSLTRLNEEMKSATTISKLEVVSSKWHLNPVRLFAKKEGLLVHEWPVDKQALKDFDIGLVASFGHLIPKWAIDAFPLGMLNVHGSLLPRWRGAAPISYAIMHGDTVTGVSIMSIQPYIFDKGDVISKKEVPIFPHETAMELRSRLSEIGGDELISCVRRLPKCLKDMCPQPDDGVCYSPKITPDLGVINFKTMTATCIYNRFRALYGIIPVVARWMDLQISLHDVSVNTDNCPNQSNSNGCSCSSACSLISSVLKTQNNVPGQIQIHKKKKILIVECCGNSQLIIGKIAPFKKKPMSAMEFYNGYLSKKSKTSWLFS